MVRCPSLLVRLASRGTQACADRATPFCCIRVSAGRCRGVLCIREPHGEFTEMYHDTGCGPDAIRGPIWAARDVHGRSEGATAAKTVLKPDTAGTVPTQVCVRNIAVEGVPHPPARGNGSSIRASDDCWLYGCDPKPLSLRQWKWQRGPEGPERVPTWIPSWIPPMSRGCSDYSPALPAACMPFALPAVRHRDHDAADPQGATCL